MGEGGGEGGLGERKGEGGEEGDIERGRRREKLREGGREGGREGESEGEREGGLGERNGEEGEEGEIEGGRGEGGRRERGDRGISKHGKGLRVASSYHFRCAWRSNMEYNLSSLALELPLILGSPPCCIWRGGEREKEERESAERCSRKFKCCVRERRA